MLSYLLAYFSWWLAKRRDFPNHLFSFWGSVTTKPLHPHKPVGETKTLSQHVNCQGAVLHCTVKGGKINFIEQSNQCKLETLDARAHLHIFMQQLSVKRCHCHTRWLKCQWYTRTRWQALQSYTCCLSLHVVFNNVNKILVKQITVFSFPQPLKSSS